MYAIGFLGPDIAYIGALGANNLEKFQASEGLYIGKKI